MRPASTGWRSGAVAPAAVAPAALALVALACVAALALPGAAQARVVRVFAVQPKLDLAWMQSRATFHDKLLALADRRLRGGGAPLVQAGADDVASHLLGPADPARPVATARDLVVWPEDVGLFAALTGQRAAPARKAGSLEGAVATLIGLYGPQNGYYARRYPELASRVPQVRLLAIALTDTFGRVAVETFSELARREHAWLEAGIDMAQDWKVVCDDRAKFNAASPPRLPTGELCAEQDPQRVKQLGDPFEPARDYAYEAVTPRASNMALVFDPEGRLVSKQVKEYLTPTELPGQLDLVPGAIDRGLGALRTPVGTLGFVTSKDAWMPDVQDRLDEAHVDLLVQPEFFVGDTVDDSRMWSPDTMLAAGWSDVLRMPSLQAMVEPDLDGNVFDFTADQQSHIALKPRSAGAPRGHLVGQPDLPGLASAMPWVVPDPLAPDEPFPARRHRLSLAGHALLPGSGVPCADPSKAGPCENGQVEGVLWRDVTVDRRPRLRRWHGRRARTRPFTRSRPVHRSRGAQRNAAVALRGKRGVLAWEERRGGRDQVVLARTRNAGRTWSRPVHPTGRPARTVDEQWPAVALGRRGRVTVAWNDDSSGVQRVYVASSADGGRRFGPSRPIDPSPGAAVEQWRAALAQGDGNTVHAVFVDDRARSADDDLPQAGAYYARLTAGVPGPARRLDGGAPDPQAAKLDNAWAPRIAAHGRDVLATWVDFTGYDWGVYSARSSDGGAAFAPQARVTDDGDAEELADSPDPAFVAGASPLIAWTDFRKRDSAGRVPHELYDVYAAAPGARNVQVDGAAARQADAFAPSICAAGRRALVAYQDAGRPRSRIELVALTAAGARTGRERRVDDGGRGGGNAYRPRLACSKGRVVAAYESERDGPSQVYVTRARARRLG